MISVEMRKKLVEHHHSMQFEALKLRVELKVVERREQLAKEMLKELLSQVDALKIGKCMIRKMTKKAFFMADCILEKRWTA